MTGYWKASLGVILVFVLGCASGTLGSSLYFSHRIALLAQRGTAGYIEFVEKHTTRNLHLDPQQKKEIHAYFMANLADRKQLETQIRPQIEQLNVRTFQQVKSVLRPDQAQLFHDNTLELRKGFARAARASGAAAPSDLGGTTNDAGNPARSLP